MNDVFHIGMIIRYKGGSTRCILSPGDLLKIMEWGSGGSWWVYIIKTKAHFDDKMLEHRHEIRKVYQDDFEPEDIQLEFDF